MALHGHGQLSILYLVRVAGNFIGHHTPIGHTQLIGRNSHCMAGNIIIQNYRYTVLLIHTPIRVDFFGVVGL